MSRISTYGAHSYHVMQMLEIQNRTAKYQTELSSGKKSMDYAGISVNSQRLLVVENEKNLATKYVETNAVAQLRMNSMQNALEAITDVARDFRAQLQEFSSGNTRDETKVRQIQEFAFRALKDMEAYLNTEVEGQHIFAGARVGEEPVTIQGSTLEAFQNVYDGWQVKYPTTAQGATKAVVTKPSETGTLTFATPAGTLTAANANTLGQIPVGSVITVSGTTNNDRKFTVQANTGTTLTIAQTLTTRTNQNLTIKLGDGTSLGTINTDVGNPATFTATGGQTPFSGMAAGDVFTVSGADDAENNGTFRVASIGGGGASITIERVGITAEAAANATISVDTYYAGDEHVQSHRVSQDRTVDYGLTAVDPAFEKAIRAMALIAQGEFGTAGGLENNQDRISAAKWLLTDAIEGATPAGAPYGTEEAGTLRGSATQLGLNQVVVKNSIAFHKTTIAYVDQRIIDIENINETEVIVKMLDDQRALEASYQTLSMVREMSLLKYL